MKFLIILLSLAAVTSTNTCNKKNTPVAEITEKETQTSSKNKFFIHTLGGKDVSEEKLHITIDEERNSISGYSGCNTFSSKYSIEDNRISLSFPIASKMYCEKKTDLESNFLKTLMEVTSKTFKGDSLFLKNSKGDILFSGVKSNP